MTSAGCDAPRQSYTSALRHTSRRALAWKGQERSFSDIAAVSMSGQSAAGPRAAAPSAGSHVTQTLSHQPQRTAGVARGAAREADTSPSAMLELFNKNQAMQAELSQVKERISALQDAVALMRLKAGSPTDCAQDTPTPAAGAQSSECASAPWICLHGWLGGPAHSLVHCRHVKGVVASLALPWLLTACFCRFWRLQRALCNAHSNSMCTATGSTVVSLTCARLPGSAAVRLPLHVTVPK